MTKELNWNGKPPTPEMAQWLRKAGWTVRTSPAAVAIVRTSGASRVDAPVDQRWVWLCDGTMTLAAMQAAVERGALDALTVGATGWQERVLRRLEESLVSDDVPAPPASFVAQSPASRALLRKIAQAARTSMPVLLTGETGTGKELAARLIHQWSARGKETFVPINCSAIPNELMEGELFGYAKGAFSGAVREYAGLVAAAEGGTVFLDEIDDTPFALQVKLLRVLEDRVISRLGESQWRQVDFRILAATNRNLRPLIDSGQFGADLYERLATLLIELPPLRDRLDDLPAMMVQLIERYYAEDRAPRKRGRVRSVTNEALAVVRAYHWPGNVRELRNVIFAALVTKKAGDELLVSDLPRRLWATAGATSLSSVFSADEVERRIGAGSMNLRNEIEGLERFAVSSALRRSAGNAAEAARLLGEVGRGSAKDPGGTVRTMMKRLGLDREETVPRSHKPSVKRKAV